MKWTVTLVAEAEPGHVKTHELGQIERDDTITPASLGLSICCGASLFDITNRRFHHLLEMNRVGRADADLAELWIGWSWIDRRRIVRSFGISDECAARIIAGNADQTAPPRVPFVEPLICEDVATAPMIADIPVAPCPSDSHPRGCWTSDSCPSPAGLG
jgi:hypothetical protein